MYTRAGSGTVLTDSAGRFRFEGPRPVSYEGRAPHIHLRIVARGHEVLLSRYVALPRAKRGADQARPHARPALARPRTCPATAP